MLCSVDWLRTDVLELPICFIFKGQVSEAFKTWTQALKMGLIGSPETSVHTKFMLPNIPEYLRIWVNRSERLRTCKDMLACTNVKCLLQVL